MAKPRLRRQRDASEQAFARAWKLLGRLERRLLAARAEEAKRIRQLGDGAGEKAARRTAQLDSARTEIAEVEGLLTELSELIAANARAQSGHVVQEVVHEAAVALKEDAAGEPSPTPVRRRGSARRI